MAAYQILARKYRPQTFDEIVGQEAVATTLKNSIESNRIAHAYVFFGPRGCGKTTAARILAKALNCKKGPTPEPCGKCDACVEIAEGRSLDVMEIDAATHTQVDKVREVIVETVAFAPSRDRKKVFIIDEAHMLSTSAFNALLKTLEEPPAHVVFMLATTDAHKIPATVLSRCQRFRFHMIGPEVVAKHLAALAKKEKVHVTADALAMIAKAGGGSMRDSVSLLDQAVSFAGDKLDEEGVADLLGLLPGDLVRGTLEAVLARDPKALWSRLEDVSSSGHDPAQLLRDLRDVFEQLYLAKLGARKVSDKALEKLAGDRPAEAFGRLLRKVQRSLEELRFSDAPRVTLELGLFGLIEEPFDLGEWVGKLEGLEKRLASGGASFIASAAPQAPAATNAASARVPASAVRKEPESEPVAEVPGGPEEASAPVSELAAGAGGAPPFWGALVRTIAGEYPAVGTYLREAKAAFDGAKLTLTFASDFPRNVVQKQVAALEKTASAAAGRPVKVAFEVDAGMPAQRAASSSDDGLPWQDVAEGPSDEIAKDPGVQRVLGVFQGKVRKPKSA